MKNMNEKHIIDLIKKDAWRMDILRAARSINLPDWFIGAGFVRNPVWDFLHDFDKQTPISDIDIVYFDPNDLSEERQIKQIEHFCDLSFKIADTILKKSNDITTGED